MDDKLLSEPVDADLPGMERKQAALRDALNTRATKRKRSLSSVGNVLNKLVSKLGLDRRLREHTLMSLWPVIVGDVFAHKSRPLFMDHEGNMVVAVKDASTGQELSLLKPEILRKLRSAAASVGVKLSGLRFDMKHFHNKPPQVPDAALLGRRQALPEPSAAELNEVELSSEESTELENLKIRLSEASAASDQGGRSLSQRMLNMYERELRLRKWRRARGFPLCPGCGEAVPTLHGRGALCADCYFQASSER